MTRGIISEGAIAMLLLTAAASNQTVIRIRDEHVPCGPLDMDPQAMIDRTRGPRMTRAEAKRQNRAMRRK